MATVNRVPLTATPIRTTMKRFFIVLAIAASAVVPFGPAVSEAWAHRAVTPLGISRPMVNSSDARVALPAQPITAARDLVHTVVGIQVPCYPRNINQWYLASRGCPVTPRFRRYLFAHMRDIDPICQCQNYALHNTFRLLYQRAGLAAVAATLTFAYDKVYIVFVEVNRGAGWAVTANYVAHS